MEEIKKRIKELKAELAKLVAGLPCFDCKKRKATIVCTDCGYGYCSTCKPKGRVDTCYVCYVDVY